MFLSRWLRLKSGPSRTYRFRPTLCSLEDRTLPSGVFPLPLFPPPGPATSLLVQAPHSIPSGAPFYAVVEALDSSTHLAAGYTGTVTLSLGTADANAVLPSPYTFQAGDHGIHFFKITLALAASQTINASGTPPTGTTPITGSATTTVLAAPTLASLLVITPKQAAVGVPTYVAVEALDGSGHPLRNFTGTVSLSTSDAAATGLPDSYTFTAPNFGFHVFQVTFNTGAATGTATTVTATDGSITNQATLTVYPPTVVTHFGIYSAGFGAVLGGPTPVTVVALNAANQPVTGYTGAVTFSSTDSLATAAATKDGTFSLLGAFSYTFQASDNGRHTFFFDFGTSGLQKLTVMDSTANVSATTPIWVFSTPIGWQRKWLGRVLG